MTSGDTLVVKLQPTPEQKQLLDNTAQAFADACNYINKTVNPNWYVHIQLKSDAPKPIKSDKVIGVDFGRRDIAVTSTNKSWSGKEIQEKRDKFNRVRASLQQKASQGTRSTRRRCRQILKRLSGKERRYQAWLNHNISKAIINEAKQTQSFVSIGILARI